MGIIYKVLNKVNSKIYIGKTIFTLEKRKNDHIKTMESNPKSYFHKAIKKYGVDNFKWEILQESDNIHLLELEKEFIKKYNSTNQEIGYNLTLGGEGSEGRIVSQETRDKIGKANKGKQPRLGKYHSNDTKKKLSINKSNLCSLPLNKQEAIIKIYKTGSYSLRCIARNYNVSLPTIKRIITKGPLKGYYKYQEIKSVRKLINVQR